MQQIKYSSFQVDFCVSNSAKQIFLFETDIQSSGRARAKGSKYIHMVPDNEHDQALERIKNHHSIKSDVEKYTKFRQRDYKNWKPRKKACLNDFHNPLYSVNTGAFISEEIAYRKIHETYTRFDKEVKHQKL